MVECNVCKKEFEEDKNLHLHIKAHKLAIGDYYQTQFPRYDLHTKELIKFKNKEQYFSADFNSKRNLKSWLKEAPLEKARKYCKGLLTKRKREKGLKYTPTEVEIIFEDYYKLCEKMGLKNKLSPFPPQDLDGKIKFKEEFDEDHLIYVDSREQNPLQIKDSPTEVKGLKFGDYCLNDKKKTGNCYIERKSVPDLIGTLSAGLERFENEIKRAEEEDAYMVILVERKLEECLAFNKLPYVYKKNTRVTPDFIFHNVRELIQKFPHIQFLFVNGRVECVRIVKKLLLTQILKTKFDLQLAYDLKLL